MTLSLRPPGDKSISHRCLMLAPLARGTSRFEGLLDADDVRATARALRTLGAEVPPDWSETVEVRGPASFRDAPAPIDCGNSGTTARLLAGLVVGLGRGAVLEGDASLRARPMDRVVYPLQALGGRIDYLEERDRLPFRVRPRATGSLRRLLHRPKVASAQVKSSLLLAGLASGTPVGVVEPGRSRDHTERLLRAMGAPIDWAPEGDGARIELDAPEGDHGHRLSPLALRVPRDVSSAAFLVGAAVLGDVPVRVEGVGLNPTRTGYLEVLREMGAEVEVVEHRTPAGEPVGDLVVEPSALGPFEIGPDLVPRLLDEIPVLAVLAARARGTSRVTGAEELRVKESDRLALVASNLGRLGVECREREDGLEIDGRPGSALEGEVRTGGDHRIAMAFGALRGVADCDVEIDEPGCVAVSYPGFWEDLERLRGGA